jgi:hypothetical protein
MIVSLFCVSVLLGKNKAQYGSVRACMAQYDSARLRKLPTFSEVVLFVHTALLRGGSFVGIGFLVVNG